MRSLIVQANPARALRLWALLAVLLASLVSAWPTAARAQAGQLPDFTELVERVGPAVVNIRTLERGPRGRQRRDGPQRRGILPPLRHPAAGSSGPAPGPAPRPRAVTTTSRSQRGVGSGFILGADGYIMTNAHVVDGADELLVTLTDKREFKARVIGADRRTDVALVKIEATGLPA
jgi:serine protease Do